MELEFLVRICILIANSESRTKTANMDFKSTKESFPFVTKLLKGKINSQSTMSKLIKDCIEQCPSSELPVKETKSIPYTKKIGSELKQAISDSVQVLLCKDTLLTK